MSIIRTTCFLLTTTAVWSVVGCSPAAPEPVPEPEVVSGTMSATIKGPTYYDGRPLGAPGPNGAVDKGQ